MSDSFRAWYQEEPILLFGNSNPCIDPKTGLSIYGPYHLPDQDFPTPLEIKIGIVGSGETVSLTKRFIEKCSRKVLSRKENTILFPSFPGMSLNSPFKCKLLTSETWEETLTGKELEKVKDIPEFYERMIYAVNLFTERVSNLATKVPPPNVIICALPMVVVNYCATYVDRFGGTKRYRYTTFERKIQKMREKGQKALADFFPEVQSLEMLEAKEKHFTNFRRALKAEAMKFGVPTQIMQEKTLLGGEGLQDEATIAWNFCVALYYKAGGYPWRLADVARETCYIGISFFKESISRFKSMHTSIAQVFSDTGEGLVMKGNQFKWDESRGKSPHLSEDSAKKLLSDAIKFYETNMHRKPTRVVVHKTSRFWPDELEGFNQAIENLHSKDFITIERGGIRFLRIGDRPPLRGTTIQIQNKNIILYTRGHIPYLKTYPGLRIPNPLEILEHHGDSTSDKICKEILGLTKLNWNSADFAGSMPITLAFSTKVGQVLSHLSNEVVPRPEYKYYM
jgi:hypothetical protein